MILYHGTDSKNLKSILEKGLLPRKETGNIVYGGDLASNEHFTYLTRWNPVAHAYSIDENKPVIIKVDIDENDLYPDEDWLERELSLESIAATGKAWRGKASELDISSNKEKWRESYQFFGNVAIRSVPPEKIVAHVVLDPADFMYHCGLGAQGNRMVDDLKDKIHFIDPKVVEKCLARLDLLFTKGWEAVKKDILKERPSLSLSLSKPTEQIRVKGKKLKVLFKPSISAGLPVYICDEWQDNFPIKLPEVDNRFAKLVQVHPHLLSH
jgi:hypothetical protein